LAVLAAGCGECVLRVEQCGLRARSIAVPGLGQIGDQVTRIFE